MRAPVLLIFALVLLGATPTATSAEVVGRTIEFSQELYDRNGDPDLNADSDGKPVAWERCTPVTGCVPLPGNSSSIEPGPTEPGTTFRARLAFVANAEVITSRVWGGRVTSTAAPVVTGLPRVMAMLSATRAMWTGGWGGDSEATTFFACKSLSAANCEVVTGDWYPSGQEHVDLPVGVRFAGWHLLLVSNRNPADAAWPAIGLGSRRDNPLTHADATTRVDDLGVIQADPAYAVKIAERPKLSRSKRVALARVKCPGVCRVKLNFLSDNGYRTYVSGQTSVRINSTGTVRIRSSRLKPGMRVDFFMSIRGAQLASGRVKLAR